MDNLMDEEEKEHTFKNLICKMGRSQNSQIIMNFPSKDGGFAELALSFAL